MTENMNEENKRDWAEGNIKTIKFLTVCLCAFLGGLLAVFLINKLMPVPPQPNFPFENHRANFGAPYGFDSMPPEFHHPPKFTPNCKDKKPITKSPFYNSVANLEELPDKYRLYINLRRFNNDEKNVKVDITKNSIKISGKAEINTKGEQSSFVYKNDLVLPRKIEVDKVQKELVHNKLIYTLPLDD